MPATGYLGPLVLVFLAALAAAFLLHRLRQPPLIGFLLAGILLGPYGLGIVQDVGIVESLAEVGVVLLLFTVGLELSFASLRGMGAVVWLAGPIQLFGVIGLAAGVAILRGEPLARGILFGFLVATCSTVILLKLLVERGEVDSLHGRFLIGINVFGDLAVVPMMLLIRPLAGRGPGDPAALALALGKAAVTVAITVFVSRRVVPWILGAVVRTRQKELFTVAVLLLVFGTALATSSAGLSLALGAFLAGLVVSESDFGHQAVAEIAPFRDAFNALFFVSVGMLFDARVLLRQAPLVATVLALVVLGKAAIGALPPLLLGYGPRLAVVVGVCLAQIGEFAFVLLEETRKAGAINPVEYQVILAATIVSMLATPLLFESSHALALRVVDAFPGPDSAGAATAIRGEARLPSAGHIVILGFGHTGETLARVLSRAGVPFRVLDLNPERVGRGRARGLPIEFGDAASDRVLAHAGIAQARAVLILLSDPRATRRAVSHCRKLAAGIFVLARTRYLTEVPELSALGADEVVAEEFETSLEIAGRTLRRLGFPLPWVEAETDEIRRARHDGFGKFHAPEASREQIERALGATRLELVAVGAPWAAAGRSLEELSLRARGGASVLAVVRRGEAMVTPDGAFQLVDGDQLLLLGSGPAIERSLAILKG
ncbi:MAG TPA: cation:proton antiporter [Thermoanaerobaculia bacterium]